MLRLKSRLLIDGVTGSANAMGGRRGRVWMKRTIHRRTLSVPAAPPPVGSVPATPIDFWTAARVQGEESHTAIITLRAGERLRAESGAMLFLSEGVVMDTQLAGASSAFTRFLTGQNVFLTDYYYEGDDGGEGTVGLGTDFPSKILRFALEDYGGALICQRGAFLASNAPDSVTIETEFTKSLTAGFFGGQGFILQRLSGNGSVLIKGGGTVVSRDLAEGEVLRVSSGSIVAFTPTVQYDVGMMPGIRNVMFGGEGLFVTTLTGPGQVWLQGMPPDRMIAEIARRVPGPGIGLPIGFGMGGGGGDSDASTDGGVADAGGVEGAGAADEAAAAAASSGTAAGAGGGGEEAVAATDAAVEADRQATVAASGMDADSPSALFGDAVPEDSPSSSSSGSSSSQAPDLESTGSSGDESSFSTSDETSFGNDDMGFNDQTTFNNEPTFGQDSFGNEGFGGDSTSQQQGDLFDDTSMEGLGDATEEASEQGSSILSFLWDVFTGGGDD